MSDRSVLVQDLRKTYRVGLRARRVEALRGVSFAVERGELFGLVGPNGAGKSTTLKILMGLVFPSAGSVELFGRAAGDVAAKRRLGFLPENPYFYDYLTGRELLEFVGELFGLGRPERRRRAGELCVQVGLGEAADRPLRRYSKGMLQRVGLAQALMGAPELLVLDEPMSGLDPLGRKEVRDLIAAQRAQGRTVLFSTHILPDVELLCDRVAILAGGRVRDVGTPHQLASARVLSTEIVLEDAPEALAARLGGDGLRLARPPSGGGRLQVQVEGRDQVGAVLQAALAAGARVASVTPRKETLEEVFLREVAAAAAAGAADAGPAAGPVAAEEAS